MHLFLFFSSFDTSGHVYTMRVWQRYQFVTSAAAAFRHVLRDTDAYGQAWKRGYVRMMKRYTVDGIM
jgi:hypothetical protein